MGSLQLSYRWARTLSLCPMADQPTRASDLNKVKWVAVGKASVCLTVSPSNHRNNHGGHFTCVKGVWPSSTSRLPPVPEKPRNHKGRYAAGSWRAGTVCDPLFWTWRHQASLIHVLQVTRDSQPFHVLTKTSLFSSLTFLATLIFAPVTQARNLEVSSFTPYHQHDQLSVWIYF